MYKRLFTATVLVALILFSSAAIRAQLLEDELPAVELDPDWQPTMLIDCPTAGTLRRASFNVVMRVYPDGGILASTNIGLSNRLTLGVSYGARDIISEDNPTYNPRIEFNVKLSLIDEGYVFPGAAIGFCSQGYGPWFSDEERYAFKSKGFYIVGSKNYMAYGWQLGFHGGVNWSTETLDDDDNLNAFIGFDTRFNKDIGFVMEYDLAINDNVDGTVFGKGNGYLNMALQWLYTDNLIIEVLLKNINNNRKDLDALGQSKGSRGIWRGLRITYVEYF